MSYITFRGGKFKKDHFCSTTIRETISFIEKTLLLLLLFLRSESSFSFAIFC